MVTDFIQTQKYRVLSGKILKSLKQWRGYVTLRTVLEADTDLKIYLVGGAIRNIILKDNTKPKDFDFIFQGSSSPTVSTLFQEMASSGWFGKGPLGSPRWLPHNAEAYCDLVPIEKFNQGFGQCETIEQSLRQFDFSGNALAFDLREKRLRDPYNGYRDLQNRTIRMIRFDHPDVPVAPSQRLTWRAVVWFRLLQYAQRLKLKFDENTETWIKANSDCEALKAEYKKFFNVPVWNTRTRAIDLPDSKVA